LGLRYVSLNDRGQVTERPADSIMTRKIPNKGVEIQFLLDDDQSLHKLLYFSVKSAGEPVIAGVSRHSARTDTLLKATSYMIHKPEFSIIRQRPLVTSAAVF
jgi:hypothetical protein